MSLGPRVYRLLLRLLPREGREEYAAEMEEVVADQWAECREGLSPSGRAAFWLRQYRAVLRAGWVWRRWNRTTGEDGMSGMFEGFGSDLQHSARGLRKRLGFAAVAALTLGVGIGASTAVFSAIHAVLLRDLPYGDPDRTVVMIREDRTTGELGNGVAVANMADLAAAATTLEYAAAADPYSYDLIVDGRAESLRAWWVAEGFLESLDPRLHLGRSFLPEEYVDGNDAVAILGWSSWVGRFGADSTIVGRELLLDGSTRTVVGVLAESFSWPGAVEIWAPRPPQSYDAFSRSASYMAGVARLTPGATLEQARAEVERISLDLEAATPQQNTGISYRMIPVREHLFGDVRTPLFILAGAVGLVLLIACANVAGLLVARGIERRREFALRDALGAGQGRLIRLMLLEAGLISAVGCAIGLSLAYGGVAVIRSLGPDHLPRIDELAVDPTVLGFALLASVLAAIVSGLLPALRIRGSQPADALREGRSGISHSRSGMKLRGRLVVLEVAGAMVLLVGAGLLLKSFSRLLDEELGFDPENRVAVQTFAYGYPDGELVNFVTTAIENMEAIPGVDAVALTTNVPAASDDLLASIDIELSFTVEGRPTPPTGQEPQAWMTRVSQGLFDVLGQPVLSGRAFSEVDGPDATPVIIVNETFARRHFAGEDPVGRSLAIGQNRTVREIVGVVADVRPNGHASAPRAEFYLPLSQSGNPSLTFVLRTSVPAATVTEAAREAIWAANPSQAIWGAATLETLVADRLVERRFNLTVLGAFALAALFLSGIGIYGLGSYSVRVRRNELGIRRALGGRSSTILRLVLGEGARLGAIGVALGLVGAIFATRVLQGMLFGVEPTDPGVLIGLAVLVVALSALAALIPALNAGRVDPAEALRSE